jgi:hypothetical protein
MHPSRRFLLFSFPTHQYHETHKATDNEQCANDPANPTADERAVY